MYVFRFVKADETNRVRYFAILVATIVSLFVSNWIWDNSGLRPGNDAVESARVIAKLFVGFASRVIHVWVIDTLVAKIFGKKISETT